MENEGKDQYIFLQDRLNRLPSAPSKHCIYRVRDHLRKVNQKAYEPEILAIGPYHRGKPNLRLMEERKLWYLHDLLQNGYGKSLDQFIMGLETVMAEARDCYAEPFVTSHPREFIEMMVLDGCFIIALFLKCDVRELVDSEDPIFGTSWIKLTLMRDLLLFENQLPLCVLYKLSEMVFGRHRIPRLMFVILAFDALDYTLWGFSGVVFTEQDILNGIVSNRQIKHLLGMMHHAFFLSNVLSRDADVVHPQQPKWKQFFWNPLSCNQFGQKASTKDEVTDRMEYEMPQEKASRKQLLGCFPNCSIRFGRWAKDSQVSSNSDEDEKFIRCAKDLQEAGIKFEKAEGRRIRDIKFQNGVVKIPTLRILDRTESFFRNFIAYEQCGMARRVSTYMVSNGCWPNFVPDNIKSTAFSPSFVTDYMAFMNCLIDSENDVGLLRACGVIENWMSDDEVVSNMFNRLGDFVVVYFPNGNYSRIFREVNKHCSKRWNFHMANLKHKYFNTPWALVSFLGALLLLFLAFTQTVFAILSFAVHKS